MFSVLLLHDLPVVVVLGLGTGLLAHGDGAHQQHVRSDDAEEGSVVGLGHVVADSRPGVGPGHRETGLGSECRHAISTLRTVPRMAEDQEEHKEQRKRVQLEVYFPLKGRTYRMMHVGELHAVLMATVRKSLVKDPLDHDFYNQVHRARRGEPWRGVGFPQDHSGDPVSSRPMQEGTLGKIARMHSILKRKNFLELQTDLGEEEQRPGSARTMFAGLSIVYLIEEGIRALMMIEDLQGASASEEQSEQ